MQTGREASMEPPSSLDDDMSSVGEDNGGQYTVTHKNLLGMWLRSRIRKREAKPNRHPGRY